MMHLVHTIIFPLNSLVHDLSAFVHQLMASSLALVINLFISSPVEGAIAVYL